MSLNETYEKAKILERNKDWLNAAKTYDSINLYMPALKKAAWCYSLAKYYDDSVEKYKQIIQREPQNAQALYSLGYQYYAQKRWKEAILWFEKALSVNENFFVVKYRLGYALLQIAGAVQQYVKPEFIRALGIFSECHQLWGSWSEEQREKEQDTYFDICFQHGKAILNMYSRYSEAEEYLRIASIIKPNDVNCKYNLAKVLCNQQKFLEAKEILPKGKEFYLEELSAYIEYKLNNLKNAISIYNKILRYRKRDYLYTDLAEVLIEDGQFKEAYKMCIEACKLNKSNHKNYYMLGMVYYRLGLYKSAITNFEQAVKLKQSRFQSSYAECDKLLIQARNNVSKDEYVEDEELLKELSTQMNVGTEQIGTIQRYNSDRGFGAITSNGENVFFHIKQCRFYNPTIGMRVIFEKSYNDKGPIALNVRIKSH